MIENLKKEFIEKEIKYQIKRNEFHKLQEYFDANYIKLKQYEQVNYYFDSKDYKLKRQGSSIRIRYINGEHYEFTIKSKLIGCDMKNYRVKNETTIILDKKIAECIIADKRLDKHLELSSTVEEIFKGKLSSSEIILLGHLNTTRSLYLFESEEEVCLDESSYLGIKDYELECETDNYFITRNILLNIFKILEIEPLSNDHSKSTRFMEKKLGTGLM